MVWLSKRQNPPNLGVDLWKWAYFVFRLKSSCLRVVRLGLPFPALGRLEVRISCCHWSWETVPGDACCYWWAWQSPHLVLVVRCWRSFKNNCVLCCSLLSKGVTAKCFAGVWLCSTLSDAWPLLFLHPWNGELQSVFLGLFLLLPFHSLPLNEAEESVCFFSFFFFPPDSWLMKTAFTGIQTQQSVLLSFCSQIYHL